MHFAGHYLRLDIRRPGERERYGLGIDVGEMLRFDEVIVLAGLSGCVAPQCWQGLQTGVLHLVHQVHFCC